MRYWERRTNFIAPPLSAEVDLDNYSVKLSHFASFLVCTDRDCIQGYLAFYLNKELEQLYIPLLCVKKEYQSMGVGSHLIAMLTQKYGSTYYSVGLEVAKKNIRAYRFYQNCGFRIVEDCGHKLLMKKSLVQAHNDDK